MIPLITFDAIVNIYLTILFLIPLKSKSPIASSLGSHTNTLETCTRSRTCPRPRPTNV